jgi:hypothetical protein
MAWCCTQSCQGHTGPLLLAQSKAERSHPPATPRQLQPPPSPVFTSALTQVEAYGVEKHHDYHAADAPHITDSKRTQRTYTCLDS